MPRVLLCLVLFAACGGAGETVTPEPGRGVLVVALDALRFDHTSFSAYDRDTTPQLAAWFEAQGAVFTEAWSPGPQLESGHLALLTGCDPTVSRRPPVVLSDGTELPPLTEWYVPAEVPTLAEEFLGAGWHTAAFVDHAFLESRRGVERGFRSFAQVGGGYDKERDPLLRGVGKRFIDWVLGLEEQEDWFAYVHFHDLVARWSESWDRYGQDLRLRFDPRPELDFVPPVGLRSPMFFALPPDRLLDGQPTLGTYEAHYDTALLWIDRTLRGLISVLDHNGRLENTTLVITGTFGIGFGEGGLLVASGTLAPCDLHVPLLVRPAPALGVEPGVHGELVGLADVAPTLLALHGLPVPAGMHGVDLVPLLKGREGPVHEALFASHALTEGFAVITREHHYAWWDPRDTSSVLALSWYGSQRADLEGVRVLVPRAAPASAWLGGELDRTTVDAVAEELHARGQAWYVDLDHARQVLHGAVWSGAESRADVIEALQEKGLLGPR